MPLRAAGKAAVAALLLAACAAAAATDRRRLGATQVSHTCYTIGLWKYSSRCQAGTPPLLLPAARRQGAPNPQHGTQYMWHQPSSCPAPVPAAAASLPDGARQDHCQAAGRLHAGGLQPPLVKAYAWQQLPPQLPAAAAEHVQSNNPRTSTGQPKCTSRRSSPVRLTIVYLQPMQVMSEDKDGLRYSRPAGLNNAAVYHITDGKSLDEKLAQINSMAGGRMPAWEASTGGINTVPSWCLLCW